MRRQLLLSVFLLSGVLMACAGKESTYLHEYGAPGGRGQGFRESPYQASQEVHECKPGKINGRITKLRVESFPGMASGLAAEVQTPDKGLVHVHLGPLGSLEPQESDLKVGDEVTILAYCANLAGQKRLMASEITHRGHTLRLRDSQGNH